MERVWTPDEETDEAYETAYEKACVTIGGRRLHPRDLDAYTAIAYELADLADQDDEFDPNDVESPADLVRNPARRALVLASHTPSRTSVPSSRASTWVLGTEPSRSRYRRRAARPRCDESEGSPH